MGLGEPDPEEGKVSEGGVVVAVKRRYSDEQRANALVALAANGNHYERTARQLGIPDATLRHWARMDRHPEAATMADEKKPDMATALDVVAWKLLDAIESKIGAAPLNQTAVAMGIAIDKARLLRGQPTEITDATARVDLSKLTDKELDEAEKLARKASRGS